jgi:hypothetical protein
VTCNATFILSGYVHPDDDGSAFLYQLTESDGGTQRALSRCGKSSRPCGTRDRRAGHLRRSDVCPDNKTLVRQWRDGTRSRPFSILGIGALLSPGAISINPWGTYYRQSFTVDFTIERAGVTVFSSGPFFAAESRLRRRPARSARASSSLFFDARVGDVLVVNVYTVIAMYGCRVDDGIRPQFDAWRRPPGRRSRPGRARDPARCRRSVVADGPVLAGRVQHRGVPDARVPGVAGRQALSVCDCSCARARGVAKRASAPGPRR